MYRIELSIGEETVFRSIEELAVAIRRGVVTPKARIWHNATSKWLPIQFHPHYKAAAALPMTKADLVAGPPVTPRASLSLSDATSSSTSRVTPFKPVDPAPPPPVEPPPAQSPARVTPFKPASPYHAPAPQVQPAPLPQPVNQNPATAGLPLVEPLGSTTAPAPVKPVAPKPAPPKLQSFEPPPARPQPALQFPPPRPAEPPSKKKRPRSRKTSRRMLRAGVIGALLLGGGHLLTNAGAALSLDNFRPHRRLVAAPPEIAKRDSPRTVAAVIPVLRNSSVPGGSSKLSNGSFTPYASDRTPSPTHGSTIPSPPASVTDSGPTLEAAPAMEIPAPAPAATDSLASTVVDSTGKKVLRGILKAVSGAPGTDKKSKGKR